MYFANLPDNPAFYDALRGSSRSGKVAHAHFFAERGSFGALPTAFAFARYLLCRAPSDFDACGQCDSCVLLDRGGHPDLHWIYPMAGNEKERRDTDWEGLWRSVLLENPWMELQEFLQRAELGNKQGLIGAGEAEKIRHTASLKSFSGGLRIVLMWMPVKMNLSASNKLLKLLEEPEPGLVFLLAGGAVEELLPTVLSRCQVHVLAPFAPSEIESWLTRSGHVAGSAPRWCDGSPGRALELVTGSVSHRDSAKHFARWMRFCATRNSAEMLRFAELMAGWGREEIKTFLELCSRWIRDAVRARLFGEIEAPPELADAGLQWDRFIGFFDADRTDHILTAMDRALRDIERNLYLKLLLFDLSLEISERLLKKTQRA